MLSDYEKARALLAERRDMRDDMLLFEKGLTKTLAAGLIAALAIVAGALDPRIIPDADARGPLLFVLTQIQAFCVFFCFFLLANMNAHAGHVAALEERINLICGERLALWESEAVSRHVWHPAGASLWAMGATLLVALGIMLLAAVVSFKHLPYAVCKGIIALEFAVGLALFVFGGLERTRLIARMRVA